MTKPDTKTDALLDELLQGCESPEEILGEHGLLKGVAERFIRTLKEQLLWVHTFQTVEDLRLALHDWLRLYNEQWLVERHGFRAPAQVRRDLLVIPEAA